MKILLVSDKESPYYWDYYQPGRLSDILFFFQLLVAQLQIWSILGQEGMAINPT